MISIAKFDAILDAEKLNRTDRALAAMGSDLDTRVRAEVRVLQSQAALYALLDTLTDEEMAEFTEYRRQDRKEQGLPVVR